MTGILYLLGIADRATAGIVAVWTLRAAVTLTVLWLSMVTIRSMRSLRPLQFHLRPSTAQGLAGRYTPPVSVIVPAPQGVCGPWLSRLAYPAGNLQLIVVAPEGVPVRGAPPGAELLTAVDSHPAELIAAGIGSATGDTLVVLPAGVAVGAGFVQRIVAPLVDPFVGAAVGRVVSARPTAGLAAASDDLDRLAWSGMQLGRHAIGGPVSCEDEPFAVRRHTIDDVGGWQASQPLGHADLVLRVYTRGFAVAYVEDALALVPPPTWPQTRLRAGGRITGLRRLWRVLRRTLRRSKVLEGPEKTDVRWLTRGASWPVWLCVGWLLLAVLRMADDSWAPEALGMALVLLTFATPYRMLSVPLVSAAAVQSGRRSLLALIPWLPILMLGGVWTAVGAVVTGSGRRGPAGSGSAATKPVAAEASSAAEASFEVRT